MSSGRPGSKRIKPQEKRLTRTDSQQFKQSRNSLAIRKGLVGVGGENSWRFIPYHPNPEVIFKDALRNAFVCSGEYFSDSPEYTAMQKELAQLNQRVQEIQTKITDQDEGYLASIQAASSTSVIQQSALKKFIKRTVFKNEITDEVFEPYYSALARGWDQSVAAPPLLLARGPLEEGFEDYLNTKPADEKPETEATNFSLTCDEAKSTATLEFIDGKFRVTSTTVDMAVKVTGISFPDESYIKEFTIPTKGSVKMVLELDPTKTSQPHELGFQVQDVVVVAEPEQNTLLTNLIFAAKVSLIGDAIEAKIEAAIAKDIRAIQNACDWYEDHLKKVIHASGEPAILLEIPITEIEYSDGSSPKAKETDTLLKIANNPEKMAAIDPKIQDALIKYKAVSELKDVLAQKSEENPSVVIKAFSQKLDEVTPILQKRRDSGVEKFFKMLISVVTLGLKKWDSKGGELIKDMKSFITRDSVFSSRVLKQSRDEAQELPVNSLPKPKS